MTSPARITDLTPGTPPYDGATAIEVALPTGGTSQRAQLKDVLNQLAPVGTTAMRFIPVAFAARPTTPLEGTCCYFNDSTVATWGSVIAGGGVNHVLGVFKGANWTVFG